MSMQAINYALTLPVDEPGPRLLLILISHHVNWKTGSMFVSQEELADEARMSSRSIRNHLRYLEECGIIERTVQRDESGRRSVDCIKLVGYLEWQDVLYNGGTIQSPSERFKQPANSSGSDAANRKTDADQPEKSGEPTGNCFPVLIEPSLTINKPLERAGAPATQSAARPALRVKAGDLSWSAWIEAIEQKLGTDAARAVERDGAITVAARWPKENTPMPRVELIRDPTGETV